MQTFLKMYALTICSGRGHTITSVCVHTGAVRPPVVLGGGLELAATLGEDEGAPLPRPAVSDNLRLKEGMPLCMLTEVVGSHEAFLADRADKVLLPCVRPDVPGELVGPGELLEAGGPVARERTLACVRSEVRLQM